MILRKIVIWLLFLSFIACSTEVDQSNQLNDGDFIELRDDEIAQVVDDLQVEQVNGLLHFQSLEDLEQIISLLERKDQTLNEQFLIEYGELTDDQLDDIEEEIGFDEDAAYISFENNFDDFVSLRKKIRDDEDTWLEELGDIDSEQFDVTQSPEYQHVIHDELFRTILNSKGEIMIDDLIYRIEEDGLIYLVANEDFETLNSIEEGMVDDKLLQNPNLLLFNKDTRYNRGVTFQDCAFIEYEKKEYSLGSRNKYSIRVGVGNYFFYSQMLSKSVHYKKKKRKNKWKRSKARITVSLDNNNTNKCDFFSSVYGVTPDLNLGPKTKRKKKVKVRDFRFEVGTTSIGSITDWLEEHIGIGGNLPPTVVVPNVKNILMVAEDGEMHATNSCSGTTETLTLDFY